MLTVNLTDAIGSEGRHESRVRRKGIIPMDDQEKLEMYRRVVAQLCHENGGSLQIGPPPEDFMERGGSLMNRPTEDGGIEFRHVLDNTQN